MDRILVGRIGKDRDELRWVRQDWREEYRAVEGKAGRMWIEY